MADQRSGLRTRGKGTDPKPFCQAVGDAVRRARQERGWTQLELANASGLSSNYLARLERGEVSASLFVAQRICEALEIDLDALTTSRAQRTTKRRAR